MKFLIGDIGNTSTKICVLNKNFKILKSYNFETNNLSAEEKTKLRQTKLQQRNLVVNN